MSHTMKIWEISAQQYGLMRRNSATVAMLRVLMGCRKGQKDFHCDFVDLEKAYDERNWGTI